MAALIVKLVELSWVDKDGSEWTAMDYFSLMAFYNQLSGMADVEMIQRDTLYRLLFGGDDEVFDTAERRQMNNLDYRVKSELCYKGWKGLLVAFTLSPGDLQRVVMPTHSFLCTFCRRFHLLNKKRKKCAQKHIYYAGLIFHMWTPYAAGAKRRGSCV